MEVLHVPPQQQKSKYNITLLKPFIPVKVFLYSTNGPIISPNYLLLCTHALNMQIL